MARPLSYVPASRPTRLKLALERELDRGETVSWSGMQLGKIAKMSFGIYLFAIPWTAFAVFWTAMASVGVSSSADTDDIGLLAWAFPAFGLPFVLVGLAMLSVPFVPLWQKGKVLYAVTNKRVLKLSLGRRLDVKAVPAERLGMVERNENFRGEGSLKLAINVGRDSDGDKTTEHFVLGEVKDVMGAHEAVRALRGERRA